MAQWRGTSYKIDPVLSSFGDGINTGLPPFQIADTESTYLRNLSSKNYPALSVRDGRQKLNDGYSTPNALGQRNNEQVHAQFDTVWRYWDGTTWTDIQTGLTSATGTIRDFTTGTTKSTILMNGTDRRAWDGSSVTDLTEAPLTKLFTVHRGRVYALTETQLMFSALNLINDWTTIHESGSITLTRAKSTGTGITTFNDHVIAFTEFSMHELYGTGPLNFELLDLESGIGCVSNNSITACNGNLYWLWHDGIYRYNGTGRPIKISTPVDDYINDINADNKEKCYGGELGKFLYMTIPYNNTTNNLILVYDTEFNKWYVETGSISSYVNSDNVLYALTNAGELWNMKTGTDDGGTKIAWEFITKPYNEDAVTQKKTVNDLNIVTNLPTNSTLTVSYSTNVINNDSTTFTTLSSISASSNYKNERVQIPYDTLQNINWYRLRFSGEGPCDIHYLEKNMRVKRRAR